MSGRYNGKERNPEQLSVKQVVAAYYKRGIVVSYDAVRRMCESGKLEGATKVGGRWFVPPGSV